MKTQEQKTNSFNLRLPSKKLKSQLTKDAKKENRSLNQHLIHILETHIERSRFAGADVTKNGTVIRDGNGKILLDETVGASA